MLGVPQHRSLQQRGLLFVRLLVFTPSGLGDSLPLRFVGGLQHHCVVLWAASTFLVRIFIAASCHGVVLWFVQRCWAFINSHVSLYRLTSLTEIFASCAERFARCYFPSRVLMTLVSLVCTWERPTVVNSERSSCQASSEYLYFCSCLLFDLALCLVVTGHASTQTCVCTDRQVQTSGGAILLSLSCFQALLAPFRRLPFMALSR